MTRSPDPLYTGATPAALEELRVEVEAIMDADRQVAMLLAGKASRIDRARRMVRAMTPADKSLGRVKWSPAQVAAAEITSELAAALRISQNEAAKQINTAYGLTHDFTTTHRALAAGAFSYRHAEVIVRHGTGLTPETQVLYEARMLELAPALTAYQLETHARTVIEEAQPATAVERQWNGSGTAVERHVEAVKTRRLYREDDRDGMCDLFLRVPAVEGVAIDNRATAIAKAAKAKGDPRTMAQLRADAISDLILNGTSRISGVGRGITAKVVLTVPVLTLLGHSDEPAVLEGYGPIDLHTAMNLTKGAPSILRVLTDPVSGAMLPDGARRYRPGALLDELVRIMHRKCGFIGCQRVASLAELDHTHEYAQGGLTVLRNLAPQCTTHHEQKTRLHWDVTQDQDGGLHWVSPAGFEYDTPPPVKMRAAPEHLRQPPPKTAAAADDDDDDDDDDDEPPPF